MHPAQVIDTSAILLLISTGLLVINRQLARGIALLGVQSLILALIAFVVALTTGIRELYVAALLTLLIKGVGATIVLGWVLRAAHTRIETQIVSRGISLAAVVALTIVGYSSVSPSLHVQTLFHTPNTLPIAISMVLIGVFIMITRKKALMTVIGLITVENGLFLFALSTTYGVPQFVEWGIFFDVAISILMLGFFAFRINQLFETLNVDTLDELRG